MLLKLLLALMALVTTINALAVVPNINSPSIQSLHKRTRLDHDSDLHIPNPNHERNTYTTEEMKHFLQGHIDALCMCQTVLDEALKTAEQKEESNFDKILKHYFAAEDRQTVISQSIPLMHRSEEYCLTFFFTDVFTAISGAGKGSPTLDGILVVDDYQDPQNIRRDLCDKIPGETESDFHAILAAPIGDFGEELVLCPPFFELGIIDKNRGPAERQFPGAPDVSCDTIGEFVGAKMDTMGHALIHEYTHSDDLVKPVVGKHVKDRSYDADKTRKLDKKKATTNAESYAWFATELFWSTLCKRDFRFVP